MAESDGIPELGTATVMCHLGSSIKSSPAGSCPTVWIRRCGMDHYVPDKFACGSRERLRAARK